jgi:cation diffusion facilitator CzcD-associated flavoprotein CzcO
MAKRAAHVTMLQRSPTYVVARPARDRLAEWMRSRLSPDAAYTLTRWKNVALNMAFYAYCRSRPDHAKKLLVEFVRRQLGSKIDVDAHFTPSYKPWDQRMCLVPDGDLFRAIRKGHASVVTDLIDSFVETGIRLRSGQTLEADVIVTATGLNLRFLGGIELEVDGKRVNPPETMAYKAMMCSDVPNMAFAIGYTNASWTLKCELTSEYVCRLLLHMDRRGYASCCPRRDPRMEEETILSFTSGYVQRSLHKLPKQGKRAPWRLYQNYAIDRALLRHTSVADRSMEFSRSRR